MGLKTQLTFRSAPQHGVRPKFSSVKARFLRRIHAGIANVAMGKLSRTPNSPRKRGACPKQVRLCIDASSASFLSISSGCFKRG